MIREDMNLINGIKYCNIHTFVFEFSKFLENNVECLKVRGLNGCRMVCENVEYFKNTLSFYMTPLGPECEI